MSVRPSSSPIHYPMSNRTSEQLMYTINDIHTRVRNLEMLQHPHLNHTSTLFSTPDVAARLHREHEVAARLHREKEARYNDYKTQISYGTNSYAGDPAEEREFFSRHRAEIDEKRRKLIEENEDFRRLVERPRWA